MSAIYREVDDGLRAELIEAVGRHRYRLWFRDTTVSAVSEGQLTLAQAVTYLASAPKSNAATVAIGEAVRDVREGRLLPVPVHLRDRHYAGAKQLGHGEGYEYAHNAPDAVAAQDYLGVEREYYRPTDRGFEKELGERLERIRARLREAK